MCIFLFINLCLFLCTFALKFKNQQFQVLIYQQNAIDYHIKCSDPNYHPACFIVNKDIRLEICKKQQHIATDKDARLIENLYIVTKRSLERFYDQQIHKHGKALKKHKRNLEHWIISQKYYFKSHYKSSQLKEYYPKQPQLVVSVNAIIEN